MGGRININAIRAALREERGGKETRERERERERGWVLMVRVHKTIVIIYIFCEGQKQSGMDFSC
jgi:hypothetical protein